MYSLIKGLPLLSGRGGIGGLMVEVSRKLDRCDGVGS